MTYSIGKKAAEFRRLWEAGVDIDVIGAAIAVTGRTVRNRAKKLGLQPRRRGGQSGPRAGTGEAKQRECLGGCGKEFVSNHKGHRVCDECKGASQWRSGGDWNLVGPAAGYAE